MSVVWSLSIGKIREKLRTNQQASLKLYVKCAIQNENRQNQDHSILLLLPIPKKVKEALRTRLCGNKLLELKHLLDQRNLPNEKLPQTEEL